MGKLEAFLIHNSSQLPHVFGIPCFFWVVSCDGWFVAKPLAGGKVGKKNAVEDDKRDPPDYSESIYAVPWNKGEHDNKIQQVHHIGSETTFVSSDTYPLEEVEVKVIERPKDGILQLRPDGIVWPPCNPGTVHQGVLKFENVGAGQRGQKLDARYPESIEDGV